MRNVLAFAGSNSSSSVNKKLATFAAENLTNTSFDVLDLRDYSKKLYNGVLKLPTFLIDDVIYLTPSTE